jgi:hypothetical protein
MEIRWVFSKYETRKRVAEKAGLLSIVIIAYTRSIELCAWKQHYRVENLRLVSTELFFCIQTVRTRLRISTIVRGRVQAKKYQNIKTTFSFSFSDAVNYRVYIVGDLKWIWSIGGMILSFRKLENYCEGPSALTIFVYVSTSVCSHWRKTSWMARRKCAYFLLQFSLKL